jgi:multicomponent K+:H+ antiporter subunit A
MLVDFRAFDTIGEITVLGAVALTVFALLRRFRPPRESIGQPRQQRVIPPDIVTDLVKPRTAEDAARGYMMVPAVIAHLLLPVALIVAAHFFLRGHNEPGGGFVAGLVVAVAFLMQYLDAGTVWVDTRARLRPKRGIGTGLLVATLTGLGAVALGYPFLTTHTAHLTLPLIGDVHAPSATFFDLGVFLAVVGATLLILTALAHQSIRAHRKPAQRSSAAKTSGAA